ALLVAAVLAWRARQGKRGEPQTTGLAPFLVACGLLALLILFFATPPSTWFWANIAPLRQLQFPWRLLAAPALLLVLAAPWFWRDGAPLRPRRRPWLLALSLALIFLNGLPVLYPARMTALPVQPTLAAVTRVQQERGIIGLTAWGEYSSEQVQQFPGKPPF